jgi:hypothetical protein
LNKLIIEKASVGRDRAVGLMLLQQSKQQLAHRADLALRLYQHGLFARFGAAFVKQGSVVVPA